MNLRGKTLVAAMAVGQVGGLLPHVAVPATMPAHLIPLWGLSNGEAGLMASAYALGYMLAVPFLTTLTDRIDARRILMLGSVLNGLGTIAFGLLADGMASAMVLWSLVGIGFAGAYMPGLKALTDRLDPGDSSRSVTLYTASFSFGVGLSFLACQLIADAVGWRWAFVLAGLGPFAMTFVAWSLEPVTPAPRTARCSISARRSGTAPRSATPSPMASIASSSTACAPGWSPSGASLRQGAMRRSASWR